MRAWPGGAGNTKLGSNYGPSIAPQIAAAREHGCQQVLYLFGPERRFELVWGAMACGAVSEKYDFRLETPQTLDARRMQ